MNGFSEPVKGYYLRSHKEARMVAETFAAWLQSSQSATRFERPNARRNIALFGSLRNTLHPYYNPNQIFFNLEISPSYSRTWVECNSLNWSTMCKEYTYVGNKIRIYAIV